MRESAWIGESQSSAPIITHYWAVPLIEHAPLATSIVAVSQSQVDHLSGAGSFRGADPAVAIHSMVPFLDLGDLVPRIVSPLLSLPSVVPTSTLLIYMPGPPPFFQCKLSGSCSRNGKWSQRKE